MIDFIRFMTVILLLQEMQYKGREYWLIAAKSNAWFCFGQQLKNKPLIDVTEDLIKESSQVPPAHDDPMTEPVC